MGMGKNDHIAFDTAIRLTADLRGRHDCLEEENNRIVSVVLFPKLNRCPIVASLYCYCILPTSMSDSYELKYGK
jgi:hypothetical protein